MKYLKHFLLSSFFLLLIVSGGSAAAPWTQNERLVIGAIKQIYDAQTAFVRVQPRNGVFVSLETLATEGLIDSSLGRGRKYGYRFVLITDFGNYTLSAVPDVYGKTGRRSFYFDGTCTIRGADKNGGPATVSDPVIDRCTPTVAHYKEQAAIQGVMDIFTAEKNFLNRFGDYTSLENLRDHGMLNPWLGIGLWHGYRYFVNVTGSTSMYPGLVRVQAVPAHYGASGFRSFYIDQKGILRGADRRGFVAGASDPPIVQ